ncbi:hypothetical protein [Halochromatium roseum]|uniref:hypothetical protein n=1 Tax=Halochromatium roseum TaxID=391920 RepID=UPI0019128242|nr:hypothetical protein [Halochromatium roseum]
MDQRLTRAPAPDTGTLISEPHLSTSDEAQRIDTTRAPIVSVTQVTITCEGAAAEVAAKQNATTIGALKRLGSAVESMAIPDSANPERLLSFNRGHWGVEAHHWMLDWNWDEDRCTIRTGQGPENISRLRRFATGLIQAKSNDSVSATIDKLARKVRRVFDDLRMTAKSNPRAAQTAPVG